MLRLVYLCVSAIEEADKSIKDLLTENQLKNVTKAKDFVAKNLKKEDKEVLDKILAEKGYLEASKKNGNKGNFPGGNSNP